MVEHSPAEIVIIHRFEGRHILMWTQGFSEVEPSIILKQNSFLMPYRRLYLKTWITCILRLKPSTLVRSTFPPPYMLCNSNPHKV